MSLLSELTAALKGKSETPATDARFFCDYYRGKPTKAQINHFIQRRKAGEPVAKIIHQKGFWKRDFYVSKAVLDPRPDSETLIEAVCSVFQETTKSYRALDIGTGSGCLILSLCDEYPHLKGIGIDVSKRALVVAQKNDCRHQASFQQKDFYRENLTDLGVFDMIISNPPYIPTAEIARLDKSVRAYDPHKALDGGADGLKAYRRLSVILKNLCHQNTVIFFEIGQGQEKKVCDIMQQQGWRFLKSYKDLGGITRVLTFSL